MRYFTLSIIVKTAVAQKPLETKVMPQSKQTSSAHRLQSLRSVLSIVKEKNKVYRARARARPRHHLTQLSFRWLVTSFKSVTAPRLERVSSSIILPPTKRLDVIFISNHFSTCDPSCSSVSGFCCSKKCLTSENKNHHRVKVTSNEYPSHTGTLRKYPLSNAIPK